MLYKDGCNDTLSLRTKESGAPHRGHYQNRLISQPAQFTRKRSHREHSPSSKMDCNEGEQLSPPFPSLICATSHDAGIETRTAAALYYLDLISTRHWFSFERHILRDGDSKLRQLAQVVASVPDFHGMSLLHAMVRHRPPLSILSRVIEAHPELVDAKDSFGRTALHVAASTYDISTIQFLAAISPHSCAVQDIDEKTPLHILCDTSAVICEGDARRERPPTLEMVKALFSPNMDSVVIEDSNEANGEYLLLCVPHESTATYETHTFSP